MKVRVTSENNKLSRELQGLTGENVMLCYQCKKCTLGCPSAFAMTVKPHEMMRLLQLGQAGEVYRSGNIWICLSCETCGTRCPQEINILRVIDGLREISPSYNYPNPHPSIPQMNRIFLYLVKKLGRIYELGLAMSMNLAMRKPFKDVNMALPMFMKGKLKLLPHLSSGRKELQRVMDRIAKLEGTR